MIALEPLGDISALSVIEARWWPIQLEPILGSGERLTVGVAVASPVGCAIKLAPELDRLGCLYDRRARMLIDAANVGGVDLRAQISPEAAAQDWHPTFSIDGLSLGHARRAAGSSIEEIAELALAASSSLALRTVHYVSGEDDVDATGPARATGRRLRRVVQGLVVARRPQLRKAFNAPIAKTSRRRAPTLDFISGRLAATFDDMTPKGLGDAIQAAQISIYTLDMHRDLDLASRAARHVAYLMIAPRDLERDESQRLQDAREEIKRIGAMRGITIEERPTPLEIANDVVALEMAA